MKRILLAMALLACGGGDAQPQTEVAATTAKLPPPPPPEIAASAAPSATQADRLAPLDAGADLAAPAEPADGGDPRLGAGGGTGQATGGFGSGSGSGYGHGHGRLGGGAPEVTIRQGNTTINGRLPPEVIQRILRQRFGRFRACYERGLRQDPTLAGRVAVKFVIGPNGDVTMAADGGSDIANADVRACVIQSVRTLIFPKPEHGIVTVVYPLLFGTH